MTHRKYVILLTIILSFSFSACSARGASTPTIEATIPPPIDHIRLPMGYIPNIQYAPFYVAVQKGYFNESGIEIEFDYSFETDGVTLVGANSLQFALVSGEQVLLARAQDLPVVYVMAWWHDYPVAIASKSESNIQAPADLAGKKIGVPGLFGASYVGLRALLNQANLHESDITLDSIGYNQVEALSTDQEEAVVVYANNEPIQLRAQGYDIDVIRVADYVQLASNGLITNEKTIQDNPDLIRRMINAILRGTADVIADPDQAYQTSLKFVEGLDQADQKIQREVLATSIQFWKTDNPGYSDHVAWKNMKSVLLDMKLLTTDLDETEAFTNDFVSE